jgi:hypothetical protein
LPSNSEKPVMSSPTSALRLAEATIASGFWPTASPTLKVKRSAKVLPLLRASKRSPNVVKLSTSPSACGVLPTFAAHEPNDALCQHRCSYQ